MISSLGILLLGLAAAAAEVVGGSIFALRRSWPRRTQEYLIALSAGFILALVFLELIPESISTLGAGAMIWALAGYSTLHFFEHTVAGHMHFGEETHADVMISPVASIAALGGLLVHAFFDGFAISIALQFRSDVGYLVFLAILLHKVPEGLTAASIIMASQGRRGRAVGASVAVGAATVVGVLTAFGISSVGATGVGYAFAFTAGTAVYVGASDLIPEINKSPTRVTPLLVFIGMVLFYITWLLVTHSVPAT